VVPQQGTLSVHSITTSRRERFYWGTVLLTFGLGTALGDAAAIDGRLVVRVSGSCCSAWRSDPLGLWRSGALPCCFGFLTPSPSLGPASPTSWQPSLRRLARLGTGPVTADRARDLSLRWSPTCAHAFRRGRGPRPRTACTRRAREREDWPHLDVVRDTDDPEARSRAGSGAEPDRRCRLSRAGAGSRTRGAVTGRDRHLTADVRAIRRSMASPQAGARSGCRGSRPGSKIRSVSPGRSRAFVATKIFAAPETCSALMRTWVVANRSAFPTTGLIAVREGVRQPESRIANRPRARPCSGGMVGSNVWSTLRERAVGRRDDLGLVARQLQQGGDRRRHPLCSRTRSPDTRLERRPGMADLDRPDCAALSGAGAKPAEVATITALLEMARNGPDLTASTARSRRCPDVADHAGPARSRFESMSPMRDSGLPHALGRTRDQPGLENALRFATPTSASARSRSPARSRSSSTRRPRDRPGRDGADLRAGVTSAAGSGAGLGLAIARRLRPAYSSAVRSAGRAVTAHAVRIRSARLSRQSPSGSAPEPAAIVLRISPCSRRRRDALIARSRGLVRVHAPAWRPPVGMREPT